MLKHSVVCKVKWLLVCQQFLFPLRNKSLNRSRYFSLLKASSVAETEISQDVNNFTHHFLFFSWWCLVALQVLQQRSEESAWPPSSSSSSSLSSSVLLERLRGKVGKKLASLKSHGFPFSVSASCGNMNSLHHWLQMETKLTCLNSFKKADCPLSFLS